MLNINWLIIVYTVGTSVGNPTSNPESTTKTVELEPYGLTWLRAPSKTSMATSLLNGFWISS